MFLMGSLIEAFGNSIYAAQALVALYAAYQVIVIIRRIRQKRFGSEAQADQFLTEVGEALQKRDFDQIAQLCDSPPWWSKAVPQLILVALANLHRGPAKIKRMAAERFEVDVLAPLEYRMSWISTAVKSEPMLGLLGTVAGMIAAFGKIAGAQSQGIKPEALASDISLALITTAVGLLIAIPLIMAGNAIHVRMSKLQDSVQQDLGRFFDDLDAAREEGGART
jgi:biopolymer transport protein ExbB